MQNTLSIDVGGTRIKAIVLDDDGEILVNRVRIDTPKPCPPEAFLNGVKQLIEQLPSEVSFHRISVGFPGVVRHGIIHAAVNLGTEYWKGFNLKQELEQRFNKPAKIINDADMQGLAAIKGTGIEMLITLGTGVGCGLFEDGKLAPHLEIGHIPYRNGETFEEQLGKKALDAIGKKRWNTRLKGAIPYWRVLTGFDKLYIGGGNAQDINFNLDPDIEIVPNILGMKGGIWLWKNRT